jgi:SAM-dependent methyltransferase
MALQRSNEPEAFFDFEKAGWNRTIRGYEQAFGPLTVQTVEPTLDAGRVSRDSRVLDLCTGHGVLAAAAALRGAKVTGLDFAEEVVEAARSIVPSVEFIQGDAQHLAYPANSFDAVLCGYGIMHVPEPDHALAEIHRVLRPGGRVALSVWERPEPTNGFGLIMKSLRTHGRLDVKIPHGPDFFQLGSHEAMTSALQQLGLTDVRVVTVAQAWRFASPGGLLDAILQGSVRVKSLLLAQAPEAMAAIKSAVERGMNELFRHEAGYSVPMPAVLGSASKSKEQAST